MAVNPEVSRIVAPVFSWGAAITGAVAATAVALILILLGTGIGFSLVSPYSTDAPTAATVALAGVIWLIFAQGLGYAVGGYLAGRLRPVGTETESESNFRDGAHGLAAWGFGVLLTIVLGLYASGLAVQATGSIGSALGAALGAKSQTARPNDPTGYWVDSLLRTDLQAKSAPPAAQPQPQAQPQQPAQIQPQAQPQQPQAQSPGPQQSAFTTPGREGPQIRTPQGETPAPFMALREDNTRGEINRMVTSGFTRGRLPDSDRTYLARTVAERTGVDLTVAEQRVAELEKRVTETAKQAADAAAKTAAYFSFWSFMALLIGATAAVLGAIWGGDIRDDRPARPMFQRGPRPAIRR